MPRRSTSYNAVEPQGARRSTAFTRSAGSLVRLMIVKMLSLKPRSVTTFCRGIAPRNSLTAVFSLGIAGVMLPLISTATTSSSGTSSEAK